jgi:hypothetical protein
MGIRENYQATAAEGVLGGTDRHSMAHGGSVWHAAAA